MLEEPIDFGHSALTKIFMFLEDFDMSFSQNLKLNIFCSEIPPADFLSDSKNIGFGLSDPYSNSPGGASEL